MPFKTKEQLNNYYVKKHIKRKRWAIELLGGKCITCGTTENLEFDHKDPKTKIFNMGSKLRNLTESKLKIELDKCQLLCNAHHWDKTGRAKCGTRSKYTGGCRCKDCTEANRVYYNVYWKNHG